MAHRLSALQAHGSSPLQLFLSPRLELRLSDQMGNPLRDDALIAQLCAALIWHEPSRPNMATPSATTPSSPSCAPPPDAVQPCGCGGLQARGAHASNPVAVPLLSNPVARRRARPLVAWHAPHRAATPAVALRVGVARPRAAAAAARAPHAPRSADGGGAAGEAGPTLHDGRR
eukprot:2705587-Prymnesium_polylepis.1